MKQYVLPPGSADHTSLTIEEVPIPEPGKGEVLVKIRAVSLNYRDLLIAAAKHTQPIVPMSDAAGEIVAVGEGVEGLTVGDAVVGLMMPDWLKGQPDEKARELARGGLLRPGVLAEYITGAASGFVRCPANLSFAEAATLPGAGVTAWHALHRGKDIEKGEVVVIQGTGGVSLFALQLAKARGANIILTSSSDDKLARGLSLGADHGINYRTTPDWDTEVLKITKGIGADRIIDVGGSATLAKSFRATRIGGAISLVGILGGNGGAISPADIFRRNLNLYGIYTGNGEMQEQLHAYISSTDIHPIVDRQFLFEEAVDAYRYLHSGSHFGKIVITI